MSGNVFTRQAPSPSGRGIEEYEFCVANGWWVVRTGSAYRSENNDGYETSEGSNYQVIGPQPTEIVLEEDRQSYPRIGVMLGVKSVLLVGTEPFGVVELRTVNGQPAPGNAFVAARQIHKGELGRSNFIAQPPVIARQPGGWVNLARLGLLTSLPLKDLIPTYLSFTSRTDPSLTVVVAREACEVSTLAQGGFVKPEHMEVWGCKVQLTAADLWHLFQLDAERCWVQSGWALAVLHMLALGYVPKTR